MLNKLSHLFKKLFIPLLIIASVLWLSGSFIMQSLPIETSASIQNNLIDPILKFSTNCSSLQEEIKKDEQCRWSLNCTMSRNEQVIYKKRKEDFEKFCENP